MNNRLSKIQKEWNEEVVLPFFEDDRSKEKTFSRPFYFSVSSEYIERNKRVMLVGQEAFKFCRYNDPWPMEEIKAWAVKYLERQIWDKVSFKCECKQNQSAFWRFFRKIKQAGFAPSWNNLDKLHRWEGNRQKPLTEKLEAYFSKPYGNDQKTLLQNEIEATKPNAVIMIVGPYYKFSLEHSFQILDKDKELSRFRPTLKNPVRDISSVVNIGVPVIWTYHPTYLNRQHILDESVKEILKMI